jgi:hypothetical protein
MPCRPTARAVGALPRPPTAYEARFGVNLAIQLERQFAHAAGGELQGQRQLVTHALSVQRELPRSRVRIVREVCRVTGADHAAREEGQAASDLESEPLRGTRLPFQKAFPSILTLGDGGAFWSRAPFWGGFGCGVVGHNGAPRRIEQPAALRSSRRPCMASPKLRPAASSLRISAKSRLSFGASVLAFRSGPRLRERIVRTISEADLSPFH